MSDTPPAVPGWRRHAGVFSILLGAIFCLPPAPFVALYLGMIAQRSEKSSARTAGKIGIALSLAGFAFLAFFVYSTFVMAGPAGRFTTAFIEDLSNGDMNAAAAKCDSEVSSEEVAEWAKEVQSLGKPIKVKCGLTLYQSSVKGRQVRSAYTIEAKVESPGGERVYQLGLLRKKGEFRVWNLARRATP